LTDVARLLKTATYVIARFLIVGLSMVGLACALDAPEGARPGDGSGGGAGDGGGKKEDAGRGGVDAGGAGGAAGRDGESTGGRAGTGVTGGSATGGNGMGGTGGSTTGGAAGVGGSGPPDGGGQSGTDGGGGTREGGAIDAPRPDAADGGPGAPDARADNGPSDAAPPIGCPPPTSPARHRFAGYYGIYAEQVPSPNPAGIDTPLAKLPAYVNIVNVAFMRPDASYTAGSFKLAGTGVEPAYWAVTGSGQILRDAITELHRKNPETRVMISVGGATYFNWTGFNPEAIAAFVNDMGFDGIDLDYEPGDGAVNCTQSMGKVSCLSDKTFVDLVTRMRAALPRPKLFSIAAWSVGAFGEDGWVDAQPPSAFRGMALALLRSNAGPLLDWVNVMSFDAGPTYNPVEALESYQHYFCGPVLMGVEVPPEAWGGHVYTIPEVRTLADAVIAKKGGGMMMWELHKPGGGTENNPSAQMMATTVCEKLGLGSCNEPLIR
jgi:chitinase